MPLMSRRDLLAGAAGTFTALQLGWLSGLMAGDPPPAGHVLAPKQPHFPAKAKRLVIVFLTGGMSHIDTFDPKPKLAQVAGQGTKTVRGQAKSYRPSDFTFAKHGKAGIDVSALFPQLATTIDEWSVIRSMHGDHGNHFEATLAMHCGSITIPMPSIGSWVSHGLGTMNANLPSYVVFAKDLPYAGSQVFDASFLPGAHQGVRIIPGAKPIQDLAPGSPLAEQDRRLGLLDQLDRLHLETHANKNRLEARRQSFATARGMEIDAPQVFDLSKESAATKQLYGGDKALADPKGFAWQFLMARRMLEAGVRTVEVISGGSSNGWDSHGNIATQHRNRSADLDAPLAGFIKDLRSRGLLDETVVMFCTEFGRSPTGGTGPSGGREHYQKAFTCLLAGAGVKKGHVHGSTDELGAEVTTDGVHVHDYHATILHLLGFDHTKLTYRYAGRDFRLTDVHGDVVKGLLA